MQLNGDIEADVFNQNPGLISFSFIVALVRDIGKNKASRVIWAIYQLEDPTSVLYHMPRADRKREVITNYIGDAFDIDEYKEFSASWVREMMTKEERFFKIWGDKIDDLMAYLATIDLTTDKGLAETLEIGVKLDKMMKHYESARKNMITAASKLNVHGKGQISSRERRTQKAKSNQ